jgi:hypothetical protein
VIVTSSNPEDWAIDIWLKPVLMRTMTARLILDGLNILLTFFSSFNEFDSLMTRYFIINRKYLLLRKANSTITRCKN